MPDGHSATTQVIVELKDLGARTKMVDRPAAWR
jgi:hypothetical protein